MIFELGLFMGTLGSERTFMLFDRNERPDLPSDLAGVTALTFSPHMSGNLQSALGAAGTQLRETFRQIGIRRTGQSADSRMNDHGPSESAKDGRASQRRVQQAGAPLEHPAPPEERTNDLGEVPRRRTPDEVLARARAVHPLLGSHQEKVITALAESDPNSLTVSQMNPDSRTQPNTYLALEKLELLGLVKASAGRPKRYVLGAVFD